MEITLQTSFGSEGQRFDPQQRNPCAAVLVVAQINSRIKAPKVYFHCLPLHCLHTTLNKGPESITSVVLAQ